MNKTAYIAISIVLFIGIGILFVDTSSPEKPKNITSSESGTADISKNVIVKEGVQYITVEAKGGYSPKISTAKAGIPTKLIVKTKGTYDCSSSLVIPSVHFEKILSKTGEEIIDIGTPKKGEPLNGTCGMGMYNFEVVFE